MSFVTAAVIGGGASILGGVISGNAANNAADTQASAANHATDMQWQMYNQNRNDLAPYRAAGTTALSQLTDLTAPGGTAMHQFNASDLNSNLAPNYQFQLGQGLGATQNLMNQGGGLLSGNTLKGVNDYAQNYAGNAYQQAFQNYTANQTNIFNRLSNIAGLGQTANQTGASLAGSMSQGISSTITGAGQATAAGQVGVANAISGGLNNAAGWYMGGQMLNRYAPPPPSSGSTSISGIPDLGADPIYG